MSKSLRLFTLLTVLGLVLAACTGSPTATPAPPQAPAPTDVPPTDAPVAEPTEAEAPTEAPTEAEEPTEAPAAGQLTIWADDTRTPILLELADDFRAQYGVELVVEDLGRVQDIRT